MDTPEIIAGLKRQCELCELRVCRAYRAEVLKAAIERLQEKGKVTNDIPAASKNKQ